MTYTFMKEENIKKISRIIEDAIVGKLNYLADQNALQKKRDLRADGYVSLYTLSGEHAFFHSSNPVFGFFEDWVILVHAEFRQSDNSFYHCRLSLKQRLSQHDSKINVPYVEVLSYESIDDAVRQLLSRLSDWLDELIDSIQNIHIVTLKDKQPG